MNFFEQQERARDKTNALIFYYLIAIGLIVAAVYFFVMAILIYGLSESERYVFSHQYATLQRELSHFDSWWNPKIFTYTICAVLFVVFSGSLYKILTLAQGGRVVAESLGGRLVVDSAGDLNLRKLLNVVEEMAIASGLPVPPVYLLEQEEGINAFAAGFSPKDAVIGVTLGTVSLLDRDELQGVIAHEFSHILNGDMRLNIRLMGIVHGILMLATTGYWMMRMGTPSRRRVTYSYSSDGSGSKKGGGAGGIAVLGFGLMCIGYIGVFFGKLIKSAVSREREYLADASAVQFTRNPVGIANALKKIGGFPSGSRLEASRAEEASHLFFSDGIRRFFDLGGLMATHPPLQERIKRIDPSFAGDYAALGKVSRSYAEVGEAHQGLSMLAGGGVSASAVAASVADVHHEHIAYAQEILAALPEILRAKARESYGARAIVLALLIDEEEKVQEKQFNELATQADKTVFQETLKLYKDVQGLERKFHFPLLELCLPALSYLSKPQYLVFKENLENLIYADQRVNIFEYAIQKVVSQYLDVVFAIKPAYEKSSLVQLQQRVPQLSVLLSCLSYIGQKDEQAAEAFSVARDALSLPLEFKEKKSCKIKEFDLALESLRELGPQAKKQLLEACVLSIQHDGKIAIAEAELLRVIACILDCPLPPFML